MRFLFSIQRASAGFMKALETEPHLRIECVAGFLVVALGLFLHLSLLEWIVVFLLVGWVISLELLNSVFERVLDIFKPRLHSAVGEVKDLLSAMVLWSAFISTVIGFLIFFPKLLIFFVEHFIRIG
ncbi:MAG: diacylglycerol kinase [Parcubacteria group bacterium Gr01-1014_18]|nr:MAG: diacylglycerol kinase [Parcubacteria group bacterium Greene0416_36]TSC81293.1 MAG: diacylglycerol kinase [Parcubacteria group bacterium Gr01-1014_18]TSC99315.1 MAG: diacylglycerol kinase [Parcubacteria group bacterium Greene1014_20]TSD06848.1 MAG: diacylglycerol kinase [Parcubacteria group bacterium Greene0714_2]